MASEFNITKLSVTAKNFLNGMCHGMEPWEIILCTFVTVLLIFYLTLWLEEMYRDGISQRFWYFLRQLPFLKQSIEKKMKSSSDEVEKELLKGLENKIFLRKIPEKHWNSEDILKEIGKYLSFGRYSWQEGYVSGAVYPGNDESLKLLIKNVYGETGYTNPLHPDVFPGIRVMEAEIIQMVSSLFNAPQAVGTVTSGGTESIFLACKAYRDFAKFEKGIKNPNMVIPVTAHAAFDKAAQILKVKVKHVKFDPLTTKVDLKAMKSAVDRNTCMVIEGLDVGHSDFGLYSIVGSAPAFPHGSIDPIEEIAKLGLKKKIPVHVDACLGGFLLPFMEQAGFIVPPFDFSVPGVTSISVDTHKYAFAPKGSSIILYRDKIYRHYQFSVQPDWPGGIYGTPNLSGSRSGGVIATCWASLLYHGEDIYIKSTQKIISVTKYIENGLKKINHIFVYGCPEVSVIAVGSKSFDIYRLSSALTERGWNLNILQFPAGFHICITMQHTYEGVADKFLTDVEQCTAEIMKNPSLPTSGTAAIYGMAQQIPDRSLVSELVWAYLDACYSIKNPKVENGIVK